MKKLLLIIILIPIFLHSQINENEFYNISNFYLNILKIDKGEYLFFGDKGVILRTYDYGETFSQNYSGTRNYILEMKNHRNYIVGFTNANEFMASLDKGSHWTVSRLKDSLVSVDANNDFVALATDYQNILVSTDVGKSWKKIKVNDNYFVNIFVVVSRIFLIQKNGFLIYSDDMGENWENVKMPPELVAGQYYVQKDGNNITFKTVNSIFELNNDLSFTETKFDTNYGIKYASTDDGYIFALGNANNRLIDIYSYDKNSKIGTKISQYTNDYFYANAFRLVDIIADENIIIMTCENRAIIKSTDYGKTWDVISYTPLFESGFLEVWDEKNWSIISPSLVYQSKDGGATFKPGKDNLIDVTDTTKILSFIRSYHYFNKDSAIYFIKHQYNNTTKREVYTTNDGGNTLIAYEAKFPENLHFVSDMGDYLIVAKSWDSKKEIFYKLSKDFKLDSINSIDSVFFDNYQTLQFNNKIYIFYNKSYNNSNSPHNVTIAVSDDSLKTIRDIFTIENDSINIVYPVLKSKNGNIYFKIITSVPGNIFGVIKYFRLDTKSDKVYGVEIPFSIASYYQNKEYIEDQKYFSAQEVVYEDTSYKYKYVEVKVNGTDFEYDTVGNNKLGLTPINLVNSDYLMLYGGIQQFYKKIELDRLTSVNQVENVSETIQIWPFTPTPNPARSKIKVKFYTEAKDKIKNMKVNLINIATGSKQEIKNYKISFTNNWNGEITFDISDFFVGSYLINLSISDYSRSSKLIINR